MARPAAQGRRRSFVAQPGGRSKARGLGVQRRECRRRHAVRDAEAQRPQCFRSDGHSAQAPRIVHRRTEEHSPRHRSARRAEADVRSDRGARHRPRGSFQAGAGELAGVGDGARERTSGRRRGRRDWPIVTAPNCGPAAPTRAASRWFPRRRRSPIFPSAIRRRPITRATTSPTRSKRSADLNRGLLVTAQLGRGLQLCAFELAAGNRGMALSSAD